MKIGIEEKVVAITGASSGMGESLASRGANVVLGARRTDRLESLTNRIRQAGGQAAYRQTDVTKRDDLVQLAGG